MAPENHAKRSLQFIGQRLPRSWVGQAPTLMKITERFVGGVLAFAAVRGSSMIVYIR